MKRVAGELSACEVSEAHDQRDALTSARSAVTVGPKRGMSVDGDGAAGCPEEEKDKVMSSLADFAYL